MDEQQESGEKERLRTHPSERFAGESHAFDLGEVLRDLHAEAHPAEHGHRQITIFQRAPVTQVLFAFEPGGELTDHTAHGLVTIHVLEGQLVVQADGRDYELRAGCILVLNPEVRHNVRALEASAMLLTVHLEGENDMSGGQRERPDRETWPFPRCTVIGSSGCSARNAASLPYSPGETSLVRHSPGADTSQAATKRTRSRKIGATAPHFS